MEVQKVTGLLNDFVVYNAVALQRSVYTNLFVTKVTFNNDIEHVWVDGHIAELYPPDGDRTFGETVFLAFPSSDTEVQLKSRTTGAGSVVVQAVLVLRRITPREVCS